MDNKQTLSDLDKFTLDAMVRLVRKVKWGQNRDKLMAKHKSLNDEASFERGWDNYSTAAQLNWEADLHKLAAEVRFPREGDVTPRLFINSIHSSIATEIAGDRDYDVSTLSQYYDSAYANSYTDLKALDRKTVENIIDELHHKGCFDNPAEIKEYYFDNMQNELEETQIFNM